MLRSVVCGIFGLAVSCGAAPAGSGEPESGGVGRGGEVAGGEAGAGGSAAAPIAACPATFAEALTVQACTLWTSPECTYDTRRCGCAEPPQCGGAERAFPPGSPGVWRCTSPDPAVTRPDGCPLAMPADGRTCGGTRACDYSTCSWNQQIAHCRDGAWRIERHMSSPPP